VLLVLLLMIISVVLVFLGLLTGITSRTQGTSLFTHQMLTYAGLLVTLLSHMVAFSYIMGLRRLLLAEPPEEPEDDASTNNC
jgi:ethanolamine transporter EutH